MVKADVPPIAWHECAECSSVGLPWANGSNSIAYFNTKGEGRTPPPQQWQSNMRRGYHASIAYVFHTALYCEMGGKSTVCA